MKLLLLALSCPIPLQWNKTKFPWNEHDKTTMKYCQKRCGSIYKDAPCLKKFIKFGKQDYHCICGMAK